MSVWPDRISHSFRHENLPRSGPYLSLVLRETDRMSWREFSLDFLWLPYSDLWPMKRLCVQIPREAAKETACRPLLSCALHQYPRLTFRAWQQEILGSFCQLSTPGFWRPSDYLTQDSHGPQASNSPYESLNQVEPN